MKIIKKKVIYPCVFVIMLVTVPVLWASNEPTKAYKIGPADVLTMIIYAGGVMQYESDLTVTDKGTINAPFIGTIKAAGYTPSQLEKALYRPLSKDYFVNPKVDISIKEYHSIHYYILGAVLSPGLYEMPNETGVLELIAKAGGVSTDRTSIAYIMRGTEKTYLNNDSNLDVEGTKAKETIDVDLGKLLDQGDLSENKRLKSGDVIYIPLKQNVAESKIYVEGEVQAPGLYEYQQGMTALNACIMAGGFNDFAAPNRTHIIRQKGDEVKMIKVNLNNVKSGKIPDVKLVPGDRIHVPESWL